MLSRCASAPLSLKMVTLCRLRLDYGPGVHHQRARPVGAHEKRDARLQPDEKNGAQISFRT
jgi:hypothetical protein